MTSKRINIQIDQEDKLWFLNYVKDQVNDGKKMIIAGQWLDLARMFHGLKGSGSSFGYQEITELGKVGETASGTHDHSQIESCLKELDQLVSTQLEGQTT